MLFFLLFICNFALSLAVTDIRHPSTDKELSMYVNYK